jgi:hypothetical protein
MEFLMDILGYRLDFWIRIVIDRMEKISEILLKRGINKSSGYFTIGNLLGDAPLAVIKIGDVPEEKAAKYFSFSQEKYNRLRKMYSEHGHMTSWQSRDESKDMWGGAIIVADLDHNRHILSFSGLPELADEALMINVARYFNSSHIQLDSDEMAKISNNHYYQKQE